MADVILNAETRTVVGKQVSALRRAGYLPGVVYGSGIDSQPVQLNLHETTLTLRQVTATTLLTLNLAGKTHKVLIRDKQYNYLRGELTHIDFLAISMTERLRVEIPLEFVGESDAIDNLGGILVTNMNQLSVECLPGDLVDSLQVDISALKEFGDSLTVKDIPVPDTLTVLDDLDEMVALIATPRPDTDEDEEEGLDGDLGGEPEVIEKGKKEEDED